MSLIHLIICLIFATNCVTSLPTTNTAPAYVLGPQVCSTRTCMETASIFRENMNASVDPCDDFYEYACGNFSKNEPIPGHKTSTHMLYKLESLVDEKLRDSFEQNIKDDDPIFLQKLLQHYQVCMNEEQIDANSVKEFLDLLDAFGGWPVLKGNSWNESNFDWIETINKIRKTGFKSYTSVITVSVDQNYVNNTLKSFYLHETKLSLNRDILVMGSQDRFVRAYHDYMVDLAVVFGANREQARKELFEVVNFQIQLAEMTLTASERRDTSQFNNPMKISELESKFPEIPWLRFLNSPYSPHVMFKPSDEIIVEVPEFFKNYVKLLSSTSKRTLANHVYWGIMYESVGVLSSSIRDIKREFLRVMHGKIESSPRWQTCVNSVKNNMHLAAGAIFVRKYFNPKAKDNVATMIDNIKRNTQQTLKRASWMNPKTIAKAVEKLDMMISQVGYPDELLNDEKLNNYYENLTVYPTSYLKTILNGGVLSFNMHLNELKNPINKLDWQGVFGEAFTVDAFYSNMDNMIIFPAGILQGVFFNDENPKYVNYAGIGSFVAHEMMHAFDDKGRRYDSQGRMISWWDSETEKNYLEKTKCIVDQYNNYTVEGHNVNGNFSLGENIADNAGLKAAHVAYDVWQSIHGEEPRLPGFEEFTPRQMFWIANANMWCSRIKPEAVQLQLLLNNHSPNQFRVKGPMSNIPEFSEDFQCAPGRPMNPHKKCAVW